MSVEPFLRPMSALPDEVLYPSKRIAVYISRSLRGASQVTLTFAYDDNSTGSSSVHGDMLLSLDHRAQGFAKQAVAPFQQLLSRPDGSLELLDERGDVIPAENWSLPLELPLNEQGLQLTVARRQVPGRPASGRRRDGKAPVYMELSFRGKTAGSNGKVVEYVYPCVHSSKVVRAPKPKPALPASTFRTYSEEELQALQQGEVREILADLQDVTRRFGRVDHHKYAEPEWKEVAHETPRLAEAMQTMSLDDPKLRTLTTKEAMHVVDERNPILTRGAAIRNNSGKYCLEVPIPKRPFNAKKLRLLQDAAFDEVLGSSALADKLVCVCVLASWNPSCGAVQQMLEFVNGRLNPEDNVEMMLYDMSQSRMLRKRYNLKTVPALLMFYNEQLVRAEELGGRQERLHFLKRNAPQMLYLDSSTPNFRFQSRVERQLKSKDYTWDLAIGLRGVQQIAERNKYAIVLVDLDVPSEELKQAMLAIGFDDPDEQYVLGMARSRKCEHDESVIKPSAVMGKTATAELTDTLERAVESMSTGRREHKGVTQEDMLERVRAAKRDATAGFALPEGFRFED